MNRLLVLQTILETKSFTKAAVALGYTQSSVSQIISGLENEMGIKLLKRSRNGVALTIEGKELYPYIQQSINQYQVLEETAHAIRGLKVGTVRIGAITSISCYWLPPLFKEFQKEYPGINFELHQGDYGTISEWVRTGQVDFGLMTANCTEGLQTDILKTVRMNAYLPSDHPLAGLSAIPIEKLAKDPFILIEGGGYSEPLNAFKDAGITPNVKYRIQDDYTIMAMVEAGLGVSILSELVSHRATFNIVSKPIQPAVVRPIAAAYRNKLTLPIASRYFIEFMNKHRDKLPS